MRLEKKTTLLVSLIFIGTITAFATLQHQKPTKQTQAVTEADPRPIVDYAGSTHDKNEPQRHSRGKRYDGGAVQRTGTQDGLVTFFDDWDFNVSAIPAGMSDAVVAGTVTDSKAYLSPDGTGVYSEFTLKVEKILKDRSGTVSTTAPLAIDRAGGRVRYPSGDIVKYIVSGQGMPRVNKRYVFFLKLEDQDFRILTGYELGAGGVSPLDMTVEKFKKYKGVDEATFLNQIRNAINSGSDTSGGG